MATLFFKWLYPESSVIAFEPDPATFELLQQNIEGNRLSDVTAHNVALWDENGRIPFFIHAKESGSLLMSAEPSRMQGKKIEVEARRLSDFVSGPVDLLKLDVEGAESRVICDLLTSGNMPFIRQMIVEYHHHIRVGDANLGSFLSTLETNGWNYQVHSSVSSPLARDVFQDVLIYGYR